MALKMFNVPDSICDGVDGVHSAADSDNLMYEKFVSESDCDW